MIKMLIQILFYFVAFAALQLARGDEILSSLMSGFLFAAFMAFFILMISQMRGK